MIENNMNNLRDVASVTAPSKVRITRADIEAKIDDVAYQVLDGGRMTICLLTLKSGFQVLGQASCQVVEDFVLEKGTKLAYEKAIGQIWELEAYLQTHLRSQYAQKMTELNSLLSGMHGAEDYVDGWVIGMCEDERVVGPFLARDANDPGVGRWVLDIDQARIYTDEGEAQGILRRMLDSVSTMQDGKAVDSPGLSRMLGIRHVWRFNPRNFPGVEQRTTPEDRGVAVPANGGAFLLVRRGKGSAYPLYFVSTQMRGGEPESSWSELEEAAMRFPSPEHAEAFLARHLPDVERFHQGPFGVEVKPATVLKEPPPFRVDRAPREG